MLDTWRTRLLFLMVMLLTASRIVAQTPEAQLNGIDLKEDAGLAAIPQLPSRLHPNWR